MLIQGGGSVSVTCGNISTGFQGKVGGGNISTTDLGGFGGCGFGFELIGRFVEDRQDI
jgi:hypothetical protein